MPILEHDVNGLTVGQRQEDGYVNATAMCQACGKRLNNYLRTANTKAYLEELSVDTRKSVSELVQVRKGGKALEQGTWVHPDVAIHLAQWCSPKFAVQVSRWVREWMITGQNPIKQSELQIESPRWYRRLVDYHRHNNVTRDRFCVFYETTTTVVANLEALGYLIPDRLMLDISTGLGFRHYLVRRGYDLEEPGFRTKYQLRIPLLEHPGQWQTVEPWQYKLELLGEFRSYINQHWWPQQSLQYFRKVDPVALPFVFHHLGLPEQQRLNLLPEC